MASGVDCLKVISNNGLRNERAGRAEIEVEDEYSKWERAKG
jgi:hypothetical protein